MLYWHEYVVLRFSRWAIKPWHSICLRTCHRLNWTSKRRVNWTDGPIYPPSVQFKLHVGLTKHIAYLCLFAVKKTASALYCHAYSIRYDIFTSDKLRIVLYWHEDVVLRFSRWVMKPRHSIWLRTCHRLNWTSKGRVNWTDGPIYPPSVQFKLHVLDT